MSTRRECLAFAGVLGALVAGFFHETLFGGKVLSPADVVFVQESFRGPRGRDYEPANRLLMDPVLQFQPWLEFNRAMLRRGRLPLWNGLAGCGAPHLANGQSAVFDPFHAIAYLGRLPEAHAPMAAARLWMAGLGMFLLARLWGLGPWGRWFAGLAYPFCGFLVVWLLYPVASVAVWMPWLFWATEHLLRRTSSGTIGGTALVVGLVLLAGHAQTGAHVLIAAGLYVLWRLRCRACPNDCVPVARHALAGWLAAVALGVAVAAIEVVPLGCYLAKSPVWSDRAAARRPIGEVTAPRWADAARTALPYALGSQRRGHPNLARALGGHNLNEAAGGFAGLATLIWLAPAGWAARRGRPQARFLAGLVALGAMGAFGVVPVENLLRAVPVLNVTDNRRLTLWVAFGLALLGGIGLDHLETARRGQGWACWIALWGVVAVGLLMTAAAIGRAEPRLRARALEHYDRVAADSGLDADSARAKALGQVRRAVVFLPRYLAREAGLMLALTLLATSVRRDALPRVPIRALVLGLTVIDLLGFGFGLNPAIPREEDRPEGPVIARLRRVAPPPARILAVGAELPPNLLMRYGLADARNYDSVELERSLRWFEPLFEPEAPQAARTSRRRITWSGVLRAGDRLRAAGVAAVIGAAPPPTGSFARVERVGGVWIAWLPTPERPYRVAAYEPGAIRIEPRPGAGGRVVVPEVFDPGWRAEVDGRAVPVGVDRGTFLAVSLGPGARRLSLRYDPPEVRLAGAVSLTALAAIAAALGPPPVLKNRRRAWTTPGLGLESRP